MIVVQMNSYLKIVLFKRRRKGLFRPVLIYDTLLPIIMSFYIQIIIYF